MRYWIFLQNKVTGPYDPETLRAQAGFGPHALVCPETGKNKSDWVKAQTVEALRELFSKSEPVAADAREIGSACDVMVFDDSLNWRQLYIESLEQVGYIVETYEDGTNALNVIRERRPKLVIFDVMMPGVSGYRLTEDVKKDPRLKTIQVLIATGRAFEKEQTKARQAGADGFLKKPVSVAHLITETRRLIGEAPKKRSPDSPANQVQASRLVVWGASEDASGYCVTLEDRDNLLILDAGPALLKMESIFLKRHSFRSINFLFSCLKPETTSGLASLSVHREDPNLKLRVWVPELRDASTEMLRGSLPNDLNERIEWNEAGEKHHKVTSNVQARSFFAHFPDTAVAYRIELGIKTVGYAPFNELQTEPDPDFEQKLKDHLFGSDILLHNARFLEEDASDFAGKGYSSVQNVARFARDASVETLLLFGVHAGYDPAKREKILPAADEALAGQSATSAKIATSGLEHIW